MITVDGKVLLVGGFGGEPDSGNSLGILGGWAGKAGMWVQRRCLEVQTTAVGQAYNSSP